MSDIFSHSKINTFNNCTELYHISYIQKIRKDNEKFAPLPDRVLIFHNSPEKSLQRIEISREKKSAFEKRDYLIDVQNIFKSFSGSTVRFILSDDTLENVHENVVREIKDLFKLNL